MITLLCKGEGAGRVQAGVLEVRFGLMRGREGGLNPPGEGSTPSQTCEMRGDSCFKGLYCYDWGDSSWVVNGSAWATVP